MPDPTAPPAHPWIKTARTVVAGLLTAAVLIPVAVNAAGIDVTAEGWGWLAGILGVLAAFTRIMAVPAINAALQKVLGLGSKDVEAGQVVALQGPAQTVVAGEASTLPTGEPLQAGTTVAELGQGGT
jgi:hypothetical protein